MGTSEGAVSSLCQMVRQPRPRLRMSTRSKPGTVVSPFIDRERARVAVVVLDHHRLPGADQRLVGRPGAGREDRLLADDAVALAAAALALAPVDGEVGAAAHDHDLHRVGVVGDRDVVAPQERRRRPRAGVRLARLRDPVVVVADAPRLVHAALAGVEAVQRPVGDDEHAARVVDRERVRDPLAEAARDDPARAGLDPADHALRRREPDPPVPVGKRGDDPVALRDDAAEVEVADRARSPGPPVSSMTNTWRVAVGVTTRSRLSR